MSRLGRWARDLVEVSLIALWLGLLVRTFVGQVYQVPSASMEPLLRAGDYVLVNKLVVRGNSGGWTNRWLPQRRTARGDVLVFPDPLETTRVLVKRCLGGSGDHLQVRDKVLFINRERVEESYVQLVDERVYPASSFLPQEIRVRDQFGPIVVPAGDLFCMGDNRDRSLDSRHWGAVEERRVLGQAVFGLRLPSKSSEGEGASEPLENPEDNVSPGQAWGGFRIR